jgi:nitroreductase
MDLYEAIKTRKSVRRFQNLPVEESTVNKILGAARLAPSANNSQEWRFVIVRNPETRKALADAASRQDFVAEAPVVIVCCAETEGEVMRNGLLRYPVDVTLAIDHLMLAAAAEGLGTCWVGAFNPGRVKAILDIPKGVEVVAVLPLGYPEYPDPQDKNRLPLDRIVYSESWK